MTPALGYRSRFFRTDSPLPPSIRHHLARLGLAPGECDEQRVRERYRQLVRQHHPDVCGGDTARFQTIQDSYDAVMRFYGARQAEGHVGAASPYHYRGTPSPWSQARPTPHSSGGGGLRMVLPVLVGVALASWTMWQVSAPRHQMGGLRAGGTSLYRRSSSSPSARTRAADGLHAPSPPSRPDV